MSKQQKTNVEVLQKLRSYCAYRERAEFEVWSKGRELELSKEEAEKAVALLKQEGFVDDNRFAELYARSKFRQNNWGKYKIRAALTEKRVGAGIIDLALTEIDSLEYEKTAEDILDGMKSKGKSTEQIFQGMKQKGFEGELIYSLLKKRGLV